MLSSQVVPPRFCTSQWLLFIVISTHHVTSDTLFNYMLIDCYYNLEQDVFLSADSNTRDDNDLIVRNKK